MPGRAWHIDSVLAVREYRVYSEWLRRARQFDGAMMSIDSGMVLCSWCMGGHGNVGGSLTPHWLHVVNT